MKVLISIEHPAWAHQFHYLYRLMKSRGHEVKVVAIDKDGSVDLLNQFQIPYELVSPTTGKGFFQKVCLLFLVTKRIFMIARRFKPDVFIGRASPMMAMASFLSRKPHILYDDTERCWTGVYLCKIFSQKFLTNDSFKKDLGKKHVRVPSYKELFYLHPTRFTPDPNILRDHGIDPESRFVVLRFVAWNASHDIGYRGMSLDYQKRLIETLEPFSRIFISTETRLPDAFSKYAIPIPLEKIHHLLFYSTLYVGEGGTMAAEAAVLGVHSLFVSPLTTGYLDEMESRYQLVWNFSGRDRFERAHDKAKELIVDSNLRVLGQEKRRVLLSEKIDLNDYFLKLVEEAS